MKVARVLANPCRKDGRHFIIDTAEVYMVHVKPFLTLFQLITP